MMRKLPSHKPVSTLLVICHGNICRSPIAAGLLSAKFSVRQGGFYKPGRKSPPKIRRASAALRIDLESHRSRLFTDDDCAWADLILYMDGGNAIRLLEGFRPYLRKFVPLASFIGEPKIPDPNFLKEDSEAFARSMLLLKRACAAFIEAKGK